MANQEFQVKRRQWINLKHNGKISACGFIDYDKRFYFAKRDKSHLFLKFQGLGLSSVIIDDLERLGIDRVIILFNNEFLKARPSTFYLKGIKYIDEGDEQFILPLEFFEREKSIKEMQETLYD